MIYQGSDNDLIRRLGRIGAMLALALVAALSVPFVPQDKNTCAAASLSMVLRYWGHPASHGEIAAALTDAAAERHEPYLHGILGSRLATFARERGLTAIAYEGDLGQLREYVAKGRPLIV